MNRVSINTHDDINIPITSTHTCSCTRIYMYTIYAHVMFG